MKTTHWKAIIFCLVVVLFSGCSSAIPVASGVFDEKPVWTFETNEIIISTPIVYDDAILMRTEKYLYSLNASTRQIRWASASTGSIFDTAPPLVADRIIVVPEGSNPFAAIDFDSGKLLWRKCFLAPGQHDCSQAPAGVYIDDLQSSQGIVAVSDFSGAATAYDIRTGNRLWQTDAPRRGGPSIAIDNGSVYLDQRTPADTVQLWSVDLKTGAVNWRLDMDDVVGKLLAIDGVLYYTTGVGDTGRVGAITESSGSILWQTPADGGLGSKVTYLALDNNVLFVSGNQLTAISIKDGKTLWRIGNRSGFMRPIIFGDMVLVRDQHTLYAFDKQTGMDIGRLSLEVEPGGNNVELNPAVYEDLVLIPVAAKQIAAYRLKMPKQ